MAWVYASDLQAESHAGALAELGRMGLPVNPANRTCASPEDALAFHQETEKIRDELDYEVDGVVFKVDSLETQALLGETNREPRWAIAWKFQAERAATLLSEIRVSHGRFGRLTPVAVLEPVSLAGVTIRSASLHNEEDVRRKDIRQGDRVVIERAGDVIPRVLGPENQDPQRSTPVFRMPERCPSCGGVVETKDQEVGHWCPNDGCPALLPQQLRHFVSKRAMDIEGLGGHWCDALVESGMAANTGDLYRLTQKDLTAMERMGDRLARRIIQNVERSKENPLDRVLYGLGIFRLGREVSGILAWRYRSVGRGERRRAGGARSHGRHRAQDSGERGPGDTLPRVERTLELMREAGVRLERDEEGETQMADGTENGKGEPGRQDHRGDRKAGHHGQAGRGGHGPGARREGRLLDHQGDRLPGGGGETGQQAGEGGAAGGAGAERTRVHRHAVGGVTGMAGLAGMRKSAYEAYAGVEQWCQDNIDAYAKSEKGNTPEDSEVIALYDSFSQAAGVMHHALERLEQGLAGRASKASKKL